MDIFIWTDGSGAWCFRRDVDTEPYCDMDENFRVIDFDDDEWEVFLDAVQQD